MVSKQGQPFKGAHEDASNDKDPEVFFTKVHINEAQLKEIKDNIKKEEQESRKQKPRDHEEKDPISMVSRNKPQPQDSGITEIHDQVYAEEQKQNHTETSHHKQMKEYKEKENSEINKTSSSMVQKQYQQIQDQINQAQAQQQTIIDSTGGIQDTSNKTGKQGIEQIGQRTEEQVDQKENHGQRETGEERKIDDPGKDQQDFQEIESVNAESKNEEQLEKEKDKKKEGQGVNYCCVIYISICFLLIFGTMNTLGNLIAQIFKDLGYNGLGQIQMFMIYFANCISNFLAPYIYSKLEMSLAYKLPCFMYMLVMFGNFLASECNDKSTYWFCADSYMWTMTSVFSFIWGFIVVYLWIASSIYITLLADQKTKGRFFGIFNFIMQISYILGYILVLVVWPKVDYPTFFMIFFGIVISAEILFCMIPLKKVQKKLRQQEKEEEDKDQDDITKALLEEHKEPAEEENDNQRNSDELDPELLAKKQKQRRSFTSHSYIEKKKMKKVSLKQNTRNIMKCLKGKKLRPLLPLMFINGLNLAFIAGFLVPVISGSFEDDISDDDKRNNLAQIFIMFGVFESLGGLITGILVDKVSDTFTYVMNYVLPVLCLGASFFGIYQQNYNYMFALGAIWGYTDCCNQTSTPALISKIFGAQTEPFAIFRLMNGIGFMIGMIVSLVLQNQGLYMQVGVYSVFFGLTIISAICCGCGSQDKRGKTK